MLAQWFADQTEQELASERKKLQQDKRKWLDDFAAITRLIKRIEYVKVGVRG